MKEKRFFLFKISIQMKQNPAKNTKQEQKQRT